MQDCFQKPSPLPSQGLGAPTRRDDDRTMEFLYAASRGDTAKLRHVRRNPRSFHMPHLKFVEPGIYGVPQSQLHMTTKAVCHLH